MKADPPPDPATRKPPLPSYDEALRRLLEHAPPLPEVLSPLAGALGRTLTQAVVIDRDQPPFDRSAMDGFAVRSADVVRGRTLTIDGDVAAGAAPPTFQTPLKPGASRRIATGAPLPTDADAVIPIERVTNLDDEQKTVAFDISSAEPWQNVHRQASDARAGQVVIEPGTHLAPHHLAVCAAAGVTAVRVRDAPRVAILTTGDEVVDPATPTADLQPQQIRNSNGPMLDALLTAMGAPPCLRLHVRDEAEETRTVAREALSVAQVVITAGGVSVGQRDLLPHIWPALGLKTVLHGVAIQPGKPLFVAAEDCKLVVGLPGNPVSVLAGFHLFVMPLLKAMRRAGLTDAGDLGWSAVRLAHAVKTKAAREVFRIARREGDQATLIPWQGSGDLVHTARGQGWVRLPRQDGELEAGAVIPWLDLIGVHSDQPEATS